MSTPKLAKANHAKFQYNLLILGHTYTERRGSEKDKILCNRCACTIHKWLYTNQQYNSTSSFNSSLNMTNNINAINNHCAYEKLTFSQGSSTIQIFDNYIFDIVFCLNKHLNNKQLQKDFYDLPSSTNDNWLK